MKYKVLKSFAKFGNGSTTNFSEGDIFDTADDVKGLIQAGVLEALEQEEKAIVRAALEKKKTVKK